MTTDFDDQDTRPATGRVPGAGQADHAAAVRDPDRLRALQETALLDSPEEEAFDRAVRLARSLTGAPTALFSLVDEARQFFKALSGLEPESGPIRETPLSHSFCQYVVTDNSALRVSDARKHDLVSDNLAVRDLNVIAYLGVPVQGRRGRSSARSASSTRSRTSGRKRMSVPSRTSPPFSRPRSRCASIWKSASC